jgi:23S rRNA (uracil1939-C5)-methyltransferase
VPRHVSDLLLPLRALVADMATRDRIPQIELAVGRRRDGAGPAPSRAAAAADLERLRAFASVHAIEWWLQPKGPETVRRLDGGDRRWRIRCRSSASGCRSGRPTSPRSTTP